MKQTSLKQLRQLFVWIFTSNRREYLLRFLELYIVNNIFILTALLIEKKTNAMVIFICAIIFCILIISESFFPLKNKQKRITFLTLPIDNSIKYLTLSFLGVFFWPFIYLFTFWLANLTLPLFQGLIQTEVTGSFIEDFIAKSSQVLFPASPEENFFKESIFLFTSIYLFIISLFLLGSVIFRKGAALKSTLILVGIILLFGIIDYYHLLASSIVNHHIQETIILLGLLFCFGAVVNQILSYRWFVRTQVVDSKKIQCQLPKFSK